MTRVTAKPWTRLFGRWLLIGGAVAGLALLMLVLAGVFKPKVPTDERLAVGDGPSSGRPAEGASIVQVRRLVRPRVETAVGTVRAVHEAAVASKLLARVAEVNVKAGDAVDQGDVLVRLDDAELQARLKQAEAAQVSANAALERAVADHERATKLIERQAISRAEFDQINAALKTANAEIIRTQQAAEEARVLLDFATIRSPLTGIVIDKRIEPGDTASPGQVLVSLYEPNRMQMIVTIRESLAMRLKVGDQVPARLESLDHECLATVSEIVPQAEAASRSFLVKVTGPCPPGVYSGMFGRISIPLEDEEILVVPAAAIVRVGQLDMVDVVANGDVHRRSVQLGRSAEDGYEVLSGLRDGEKVMLQDTKASRS
jgi:RND family efflux transporter MFP subunit